MNDGVGDGIDGIKYTKRDDRGSKGGLVSVSRSVWIILYILYSTL